MMGEDSADEDRMEIAMRVAGLSAPGARERLDAAVAALDPGAALRLDPETGILHITTGRDTLELDAALTAAGFEVTAMTG